MRLDKLLANSGYGSRKEVKALLKQGAVSVDGDPVKDPAFHVDPEIREVTVFGDPVDFREFIYLMMNKPPGVISATEDTRDRTVVDLLPYEYRRFKPFPVGRLDKAYNLLFGTSVFTDFGHDDNGNTNDVVDENGKHDTLLYDALDRLEEIEQIRTATYTTSFAYDPASNVSRVTDAAGKQTDYETDDLGRLVTVVSPDTGTTRFVYDEAGNLIQKIEAFGTGSQRSTLYETVEDFSDHDPVEIAPLVARSEGASPVAFLDRRAPAAPAG